MRTMLLLSLLLLSLTLAAAGTYREALAAGTSREELERDGVVHSALDPEPDPSCTRLSGVGGAVHDESSFQVAAYLPEWRYEGANWATICATVTHLILFSIEVAPSGALAALDRLPRPELMLEVRHINGKRHDPMHPKAGLYLLGASGGHGERHEAAPLHRRQRSERRLLADGGEQGDARTVRGGAALLALTPTLTPRFLTARPCQVHSRAARAVR